MVCLTLQLQSLTHHHRCPSHISPPLFSWLQSHWGGIFKDQSMDLTQQWHIFNCHRRGSDVWHARGYEHNRWIGCDWILYTCRLSLVLWFGIVCLWMKSNWTKSTRAWEHKSMRAKDGIIKCHQMSPKHVLLPSAQQSLQAWRPWTGAHQSQYVEWHENQSDHLHAGIQECWHWVRISHKNLQSTSLHQVWVVVGYGVGTRFRQLSNGIRLQESDNLGWYVDVVVDFLSGFCLSIELKMTLKEWGPSGHSVRIKGVEHCIIWRCVDCSILGTFELWMWWDIRKRIMANKESSWSQHPNSLAHKILALLDHVRLAPDNVQHMWWWQRCDVLLGIDRLAPFIYMSSTTMELQVADIDIYQIVDHHHSLYMWEYMTYIMCRHGCIYLWQHLCTLSEKVRYSKLKAYPPAQKCHRMLLFWMCENGHDEHYKGQKGWAGVTQLPCPLSPWAVCGNTLHHPNSLTLSIINIISDVPLSSHNVSYVFPVFWHYLWAANNEVVSR